MRTLRLLLLTFGYATATLVAVEPAEEKTSLDKIPAKAAEAIRKHAAGADIKHVSKESEAGQTVYEASFTTKEGLREVTVTQEGELVSEEQSVALQSVPAKVQQTISEKSAGGKVEKVERVREHGQTTFEALISLKGARTEYVLDGKGKVLKTEQKKKSEKH